MPDAAWQAPEAQPTNNLHQPAPTCNLESLPTLNCQPSTTSTNIQRTVHRATASIAPEPPITYLSFPRSNPCSNFQNDGLLVSRYPGRRLPLKTSRALPYSQQLPAANNRACISAAARYHGAYARSNDSMDVSLTMPFLQPCLRG